MSSTPGSTGLDSHDAPTTAAFSPVNLSNNSSINKQRSLIFVHQRSPLLITTPPQITRVLVHSHYFLLPLNKLVGLVTWTSGDPWESFLLVVAFWITVLYGDGIIRYAAPLAVSIFFLLCVYFRRHATTPFSLWTREAETKQQKKYNESEKSSIKHQKSLDEIVETLRILTSRCHILLDPVLDLLDILESQTSKSISAKHLAKSLLIRILIFSIVWIALNLKPIQIISTQKSILFLGTIILTWHSQPNRVSRIILWRSTLIRRLCCAITGLNLTVSTPSPGLVRTENFTSSSSERTPSTVESTSSIHSLNISNSPDTIGVTFTFSIYENQRRWVGLGWTTNLFAYERAPWTDEYLNPMPPKEQFPLPNLEDPTMAWKWVDGSAWLIEGVGETDKDDVKHNEIADEKMGWIYYDNKWQNGRRGHDGWGCYTRRRKWYRDAELVDVLPSDKE